MSDAESPKPLVTEKKPRGRPPAADKVTRECLCSIPKCKSTKLPLTISD